MNPVFCIAEVGSTHDGDRAKMSEAIRVAKDAGADAIKYQWVSSPERLAARRHAEDYLWAYRVIAFPREWLAELKAECDAAGIEFMCSVFLPEDIQEIAPLVKRFKVSSFESNDVAFIAAHDPYRHHPTMGADVYPPGGTIRPMILSFGFGGQWKILPAYSVGLHCVSAYPCPPEQMNLRVITHRNHGTTIGLSDHSAHPWMGALAVAAGAEIIEVHFRLPSTFPSNPDYGHSFDPDGLAQYIANARFAEAAMGDGIKNMQPSEEPWARYRVRA